MWSSGFFVLYSFMESIGLLCKQDITSKLCPIYYHAFFFSKYYIFYNFMQSTDNSVEEKNYVRVHQMNIKMSFECTYIYSSNIEFDLMTYVLIFFFFNLCSCVSLLGVKNQ